MSEKSDTYQWLYHVSQTDQTQTCSVGYIKGDSYICDTSLPDSLQIMARVLPASSSDSKPVLIAVTYRPPDMKKKLSITLPTHTLTGLGQSFRIVLGRDFNMSPDENHGTALCQQLDLKQWITSPTHHHGSTLDLIFTSCPCTAVIIFPLPFTDHYVTWVTLA